MIVGVLKERHHSEKRIAVSPEIIKKFVSKNINVFIESNLGLDADFNNEEFTQAGAELKDINDICASADILLCVNLPSHEILERLQKTILVGNFGITTQEINSSNLQIFDLSKLPRTTRAQSMDVLSSQANIAGYKSVLIALEHYQRFMPMLMTAAGTVKPAKVIILGVGVAGLQAIATAKRLGAVVEASDVRPSVKDQVESLGGKYIEVPYENEDEKNIAEGKGGYAQSMPQSWLDRQKLIVSEAIKKADIVITTALIPGKSPPLLIDEATVHTMKPGSVIVDIAGGNCELTRVNEIYKTKHTTIIGYTNLPSMLAHDASILYAKNVFNFIELIINENKEININLEDELIEACLIK